AERRQIPALLLLLRIGRHLRAVADQLVGRGDALLLLLGELRRRLAAATATTAAAARLGLLVRAVERTDAQEVDVGLRRLRAVDGVVVGRARVVRHHVARLERPLLEEERVPRGHLRGAVAP